MAKIKEIGKENELKLVKQYKNNIPICQIIKDFGISFYLVKRILNKHNVLLHKMGSWFKKYEVNENVLDHIDKPEKAIFLGLFFSDGYNCEDTNYITIGLREPDGDYLDNFNKMFNKNRPLTVNNTMGKKANYKQIKMIVGSEKICKQLKDFGAPQRKSSILEWPNNLSKEMERYFMRGYFDGDGCIVLTQRIQKTKYKNKAYITKRWLCQTYFCGTKEFLLTLKRKLDELKIRVSGIRLSNKGGCWILTVGGNQQCIKLLDYIYSDLPEYSLPRKYNKYLKLKEIYKTGAHSEKLGEELLT